MKKLKKLKGANMDIDLIKNKKLNWKQDKCPWSSDDKQEHKCAEKNICVCDFFQGIAEPDIVLCSYGGKNNA